MKTIVLTGGGTAGHVMPNLALAPRLTAFDRIVYIGSEGGMEERLVSDATRRYPIEYRAIPCVKLTRSLDPKNLAVPVGLIKSVRAARKLLDDIKPSIIFSKGGYVGLPVCLAAGKIPVILHESDITLGLANRIAARKCDRLLTSFEPKKPNEKTIWTGAPLRAELYRGDRAAARAICGLTAPLPYLLVTGGSLGAKAINDAVEANLPALTKKFNVIHIAGRGNEPGPTCANYYRAGFTDRMPDFMALADFALTRGGANTLFELAAVRVPALIVPLPKTVSRGDQILNAEYFTRMGMAQTLPQERLTELCPALDSLASRAEDMRRTMAAQTHIDGTAPIARILTERVAK